MTAVNTSRCGEAHGLKRWALVALLLVPSWLVAGVDEDLQRAEGLLNSDPASALELLQNLAPATPDQAVQHAALKATAEVFFGQSEQARASLLQVRAMLETVEPSLHSRWLRVLATVEFSLGEREQALQAGRRALDLLDPEQQAAAYAESLVVALQVSLGAMQYTDALNLAAELQEFLTDPSVGAPVRRDAYRVLGVLHEEFNDLEQAREAYRAAGSYAAEIGDTLSEADARYALAGLLIDDERLEEAAGELDHLAAIYAESGDDFGQAMVTMERARVALLRGQPNLAEGLSRESAQRLDELSVPTLATAAYFTWIESLLEMGRSAEASSVLERLLEIYGETPMPPIRHELEARVAATLGDWEQAYRASSAQMETVLEDVEERLSQASDKARARLDVAADRVRRTELESELELRALQIEAADRQARWQRIALALAISLLVLGLFIVVRLRRQRYQLSELALRDSLTRLPNRRAFLKQAERMLENARSMDQPTSLLMIDLDHFKRINDEFGHDTGDEALVDFAEIVRTVARTSDLPARLGGEEFGLLLPATDGDGAMQVAERLLAAMREFAPYAGGQVKTMSASVGVASERSDGTLSGLMKRADQALYQAKSEGRARSVFKP